MPTWLLALYLPQHLLVNVLTVAAYALRGQAGTVLRAKRDAVRALPAVLRERREIQRSRAIGGRELRRGMARGVGGFARTFFARFEAWGVALRVRSADG